MIDVPDDTPPNDPALLTVPTAVVLLLHVPPDVPSVSDVLLPTHTDDAPPIAKGDAKTVTSCTERHVPPRE
jgi:hypothetical protein